MKEKETLDYLIEYWWLILATLFLILYKGRIGIIALDKATFLFSVITVMFSMFKLSFTALKNSTAKLVSNPIHTTITGKWTPIGNYVVFRKGGIRALGIEIELNEGTIVVPRESVNIVGDNVTLLARLEEVDINELPPDIRTLVSQMNWKPPYYFGLADEIQELKTPEVSFLNREIKNLNKAVSDRDKLLKTSATILEDVISSQSRISILSKRESILDKLKKSLTRQEEESSM
jgi:hypothetical protein